MAKKDTRRFFKKREAGSLPTSQGSMDERKLVDLPQNSLSIPAGVYTAFLLALYASVLFCLFLTIYFTALKKPIDDSTAAYALIHTPASASTHLGYLRWLVESYRLEDASLEAQYIRNAARRGMYSDLDNEAFTSLKKQIEQRELALHEIVKEYAYLLKSNKDNPNYRDGLYRTAQLSYMLYNPEDAQALLTQSNYLDPQFEKGKAVLNDLNKEL